MEPFDVVEALTPKTKKKTEKYLSKIDCKYCSLLCMLILMVVIQFIFHPVSTPNLVNGKCYDKREILLDSNGTYIARLCKEYLESRRYHSITLQLSNKVYGYNQIEAQTLRYFLLWCPQQNKVICSNYNTKIDKCYKAMKYKDITTCFGDKNELLYASVGDVTLTKNQVQKLEQIVVYWF